MSIKVIGTGFGRTGTDSMREALAILGFGPCHHMSEVIANEENPGYYNARFFLRPHFQLEAMDVGLSLVSRLPGPTS